MKKSFSFCFLFFSLFFIGVSQNTEQCAHVIQQEKVFASNPELLVKVLENEKLLDKVIRQNKSKRNSAEEAILTIPIVIHVVHTGEAVGVGSNISEAQIRSGIDQLNAAYRNNSGLSEDIKIQFRLARMDPNCNPTDGIVRIDGSALSGYSSSGVSLGGPGASELSVKDLSRWPNNDYYNIWIVSEFDNNNGGNGTQGFAYFPEFVNPDLDGAMIMHTAWGNQGAANTWNNMGTTGIHEIGHALNLYHTFEGDEDAGGNPQCPPGTCGKDLGDCCDDTSPHIRSNSDCPVAAINSCTGLLNDDVINNYMDYSSQLCNTKFTPNQKERMRAALTTFRGGLITSRALDSTMSYTAPKTASCYPQTSATGLVANYAGILKVEFNQINYSSGYAKADGGSLDLTTTCLNSTELVLASTYDLKITVGTNTNTVNAWIDYNNDGSFSASEKVFDQSLSNATGTQSVIIPASATKDTYIRMRVMNEIGTIANACVNPTYGQAEDYAVILRVTANNPIINRQNLQLYPNPANNHIQINGFGGGTANYQIYDQLGQVIKMGETEGLIDLSNLSKGTYFISLKNGTSVWTQKVIKL